SRKSAEGGLRRAVRRPNICPTILCRKGRVGESRGVEQRRFLAEPRNDGGRARECLSCGGLFFGGRIGQTGTMTTANYQQLDVVVVGAPPDDVEIACGGTLAALAEAGYKVGIVDLTDGEPTLLSPGPDVRMAEAKAAGEALGIHLRTLLHLPNRRLFDSFEARVKLAIEFRKHKPRLVIGLGDKTPMASPAHWQAMQITDAAVFYWRLTKWNDQFDHLPPHVIGRQLYFMLGSPLASAPNPGGQIVVDISNALPRKLAAIRCYKTQFPPEKEHLFERVDAADRYLGR